MKWKISLATFIGNLIGGFLTFLYFRYVSPDLPNVQGGSPLLSYLVFFVGFGLLSVLFSFSLNQWSSPLYRVLSQTGMSPETDKGHSEAVKRKAIRFPSFVAALTLFTWFAAGFLFAFVEPAMSQAFLSTEPTGIGECLKRFFGITCVGGFITTLFLYFSTESVWRQALPKFFPDGHLGPIRDTFSLSVRARLLIVFLTISLVPLPLLGIASFGKAEALHHADAIARSRILSSLSVEIVFITLMCAMASVYLSISVSKSVSAPLGKIAEAMREVERGNLDVRLEIVSNDEIGAVTEGFNRMLKGLKDSQSVKDSFGKYVSKEIRDQILKGKVPTDGEMKRVTLLFSDLRDFTPFAESEHPKKVVAVMNRYFSQMTEAIKGKKGLILQYVGDEIEAVFGAPLSYDDHTDMAVQAALEMRTRLARLNKKLADNGGKPLRHGIGIHTGAVLAGNIGSDERMSYAMVGDTVNLASRIGGLTKKFSWDIILSQTTYNLLTGSYQVEQLPTVKVKGREEEVVTYKLLDGA